MKINHKGVWRSLTSQMKHNSTSVFFEYINNMIQNNSTDIYLYYGLIFNTYLHITYEIGGDGFKNKSNFDDACELMRSLRNNLNNHGTGLKSGLTIFNQRIIIIGDSINNLCKIFISKDKEEPYEILNINPSINKQLNDIFKNGTFIIGLYDNNIISKLVEDNDYNYIINIIKKYNQLNLDLKDESINIKTSLGIRYNKKNINIKYNNSLVNKINFSDNNEITGDKFKFKAKITIEIYTSYKKNKKFYKLKQTTGNKIDNKFIKMNKSSLKTLELYKNLPAPDLILTNTVTIEYIDTNNTNSIYKGESLNKYFIYKNDIVISHQDLNSNLHGKPWPNVRAFVYENPNLEENSIIRLAPKKCDSYIDDNNIKLLLENILNKIYIPYWKENEPNSNIKLAGPNPNVKEDGPNPDVKINESKPDINTDEAGTIDIKNENYIKETIKSNIKINKNITVIANSDSDTENKKRFKGKIPDPLKYYIFQEYYPGKTDGKCVCCKSIIKCRYGRKYNKYSCGHIKSEAQGGKIDKRNLVPVCITCNSAMGTTHMKIYIEDKWGKDSINYKDFIKLCKKNNKDIN